MYYIKILAPTTFIDFFSQIVSFVTIINVIGTCDINIIMSPTYRNAVALVLPLY